MRSDDSFDALARDLKALFAGGVDRPLGEHELDAWAVRVFRWQVGHNRAYRGYCEGRGATAASVAGWRDIPPVPTSAFRHLPMLSLERGRAPEAVFRTSGTTGGAERRGEHAVASLALYRASLLPAFRAHVLPEGRKLGVLALIPSPADGPNSSLGYMVATVMEELGDDRSAWLADASGAIDGDRLLAALGAAERARAPVLLATTAFALVHALDLLGAAGARFRLPEGSRMMETGGFKGRSRVVERGSLYGEVELALGIPPSRIVNEYGMTELLSQFYEPVLSSPELASAPLPERFHVAPPWLRTRALDPATLQPVGEGEPGLLCHFDLANAGSVACVLTEDLGVVLPGGIRVLGRVTGAVPRGCSLAAEDLLSAARR